MVTALGTPSSLAKKLIKHLGEDMTDNGDRATNYIPVAVSRNENGIECHLYVALIEEKTDIPEDEQGWGLHVINDITGEDCEWYPTASLSEDSLISLLAKVLEKAGCKKMLVEFVRKEENNG